MQNSVMIFMNSIVMLEHMHDNIIKYTCSQHKMLPLCGNTNARQDFMPTFTFKLGSQNEYVPLINPIRVRPFN